MSEIPQSLCVLPWIHLATLTDGSIIPCCVAKNDNQLNLNEMSLHEAWNAPYMRELRQKMVRGEKPSACSHCYIEEANGIRSHRITENKIWTEKMGADFIATKLRATADDGTLAESMIAVDLRIGNTCNLQCVMCRPHESSKWTALAKLMESSAVDSTLRGDWQHKSQINESRFGWYEKPGFIEALEPLLPNLRELIIGGGEPMLLKEHQSLIETCVRTGAAKNIRLRYHTNGTVLPEQLFPLWEQFALVEMFVSVDSYGDKNHYMRYPASWSAIETNLRRLDTAAMPNLRAVLLCSVHVMSIYYLAEFSQWIEDQQFKKVNQGFSGYFHPGLVHYPQYLSAQVLPYAAKKKIVERIRAFEARSRKPSNKIEGVIGFMLSDDASDRLPQTREYISRLDQFRRTSFSKTFPELSLDLEFESFANADRFAGLCRELKHAEANI